jgi:transcriptional regulator with XRE-family HTH domain
MSTRKITAEQKEDAARLMRIYLEHKAKYGLTQDQLADELGFAVQSAVNQYLNGKIALNMEAAVKFAERFNCRVSDFSPSLQQRIDKIAAFASKRTEEINKNNIKKVEISGKNEHQDRSCQAYADANAETKELIDFILFPGDPLHSWVTDDIRRTINGIKYLIVEWGRSVRHTKTERNAVPKKA